MEEDLKPPLQMHEAIIEDIGGDEEKQHSSSTQESHYNAGKREKKTEMNKKKKKTKAKKVDGDVAQVTSFETRGEKKNGNLVAKLDEIDENECKLQRSSQHLSIRSGTSTHDSTSRTSINHTSHTSLSTEDWIETLKYKEHESVSTPDRTTSSRRASGYRRAAFAVSRRDHVNIAFRISKDRAEQRSERIEVFFYNHGMELALGVLFFALNILGAAHGAYHFTPMGGYTSDNDILRITLPIARAGGRLVTINCAILLVTACKYLWTCIRTYVVPVIPIGFPIDNVMPKYHRCVALSAIVSGCIIHTLPQIINYATKSISLDSGNVIWTFGNGFATTQLFVTGTLLLIIFSIFFATTLKAFRKTAGGFRWFWFFHMGGVAMAYPLLIIHGTCRGHPVFLYAALLPLMMYVFDVFMRRSNVVSTDVIGWKTYEDEGQEIIKLVLECPPGFTYTPGQYAELKFGVISSYEWHPFTIASTPTAEFDDKTNAKKRLVFYIKNVGRWTGALFNYASAFDLKKATKSMEISVRGPHGAPAMNYFEYKHIVVVGSGVGITPLLSIWKYLVGKGSKLAVRESTSAVVNRRRSTAHLHQIMMSQLGQFDGDEEASFHSERITVDGNVDKKPKSKIRSFCSTCEKFLNSMRVAMCHFVLIILGGTFATIFQMYGLVKFANRLGTVLFIITMVVLVSTLIVSSIAVGLRKYIRFFKFWLECTIILVDSIALGSTLSRVTDDEKEERKSALFFVFFTLVGTLEAIRIFHIFYITMKPAENEDSVAKKKKKKNAIPNPPSLSNLPRMDCKREEILSVQGIVINRNYSSMRFASRSLLPSILKHGLSDIFTLNFFGTREKQSDRSERDMVADLMGSEMMADGSDLVESSMFCPGRPDWNSIFLLALSRAHTTNPDGESVGVFFCGSPAIAKALNATAAEVTAQHQYAIKQMEGARCSCKVIVHSENF